MRGDQNILRRMFRDYQGLSLLGAIGLFIAFVFLSRLYDLAYMALDLIFRMLIGMIGATEISAPTLIGWLALVAGLLMLGLALYKSQRDVNREVAEWKEQATTKGLQILRQYHRYEDGGKNKALYIVLRNDEGVPLALSGYLPTVHYRGPADATWREVFRSGSPLLSHVRIVLDPKKTTEFRLARTDVEHEDFWIDCSMNNAPHFKEVGFYRYRPTFAGEAENKGKYEVQMKGYLQFWGGSDLDFVRELPEGVTDEN